MLGDVPTPRLRVHIRRVEGAPIVGARAWLTGGARVATLPGQALLTGRLLSEGTLRRRARRIAREAEDRGMIVESFGGHEAIGVAIDALAHDVDRAIDWLAELVREPSFPANRFTWARRQAEAELKSALDQPHARAARTFLTQLYGTDHPYGRPLQGGLRDLARLTRDDCATHHRACLDHGLLVVLTGALDEHAVHARLLEAFGDLDTGPAYPIDAPAIAGTPPEQRRVDLPSGDQAHLFLGHLTVARAHRDRPALDLLAVVLGAGGQGGRLWTRLREREGLAYDVSVATTSGAGLDPGRLSVYLGTSPERADGAVAIVREELDRLLGEGIDDTELEEARGFLLGSLPFRFETGRQWATLGAEAHFYGLPGDGVQWLVDGWRDLDRAKLLAVAREHIRPDDLHVAIGMPKTRRD